MSSAQRFENIKFEQPQWYIAEAINALLMLAVAYTAMSLVVYGVRSGKWKKENTSNTTKINAGPVYTTAVAAMCSAYLRLIPDQILFNVGYANATSVLTNWCEALQDTSGMGYTVTLCLTYLFLWFRQRSLYQHPAMAGVHHRWLTAASWGTICFALTGGLAAGVVYVIPNNYSPSPEGCKAMRKGVTMTGVYIGNCMALLGQGLLLFLFAYPLCSQRNGPNAKRITRILKRTFGFTIFCVLSDVLVTVVFVTLMPKDATRHGALVMFEVNMMLNLASVLLSFESWTKILGSPWYRGDLRKGLARTQSSSIHATE